MEIVRDLMDAAGSQLTRSLVVVLLALVVWWTFRRFGGRWVGALSARTSDKHEVEREQRANTVWTMVRRVGTVLLVLIVAVTVLSIWDVPVSGLLAVGSIVGVAVGFGAQGLVQDVIAGFFIIVEDQYGIGDVIDVGGVSGTVEDIQLRVTVLRDLHGYVHYVPNGQIQVSTNRTQDFAQLVLDVGVTYGSDVDAALAVMADELEALATDADWADIILEPPQILGVDALGDSSVVLRGVVKSLPDQRWLVKREAFRRIKLRFDREGISIAFPQVEVHVHQAGGAPA